MGSATAANLAAFASVLQTHVASNDTLHLKGAYRGQAAILHVDSTTRLAVIADEAGNFVSGWRLSAQQLEYALREGKLGGG